MNKTRIIKRIGLVSIALVVFTSLFANITLVNANGVGPIQKFKTNFVLNEYSKFNETEYNRNFIDISLPSSSWTIQDIELNFTDIKFGKELKTIEDQNVANDTIFYQQIGDRNHGLGVQLKLTEPTTIFGTDIYGLKEDRGIATYLSFQIRGYDVLNNKPNSSVYSTMELNMSTTKGWYRQILPSPILFSPGNYYLVINGSDVTQSQDDRIQWSYNNMNSTNPNLYTSYFDDADQWSTGIQNHTYLHKLIQKVNTSVYPETINMSVNIDNQWYPISNKTSEGEGYLGKTEVNFMPNSDNYPIIVSNKASESLLFNISYSVTLSNNINTLGSITIQNGTTNKWSVAPTIARQPTNYSVLFNYPSNWENISVLRDEVNITSSVMIDTTGHKILILNDSISLGADWEITAFIPNIEFELSIQRTDYVLGQELQFQLRLPALSGTYTFVLWDSAGIVMQNQTITYPSETLFSYDLNLTEDLDGTYKAYVFWFSASGMNAGVQTQLFEVSLYVPPTPPPPPTPDFPLDLIIFIIVLGAVSVGLVSYITYKKIGSQRRTKLEKFLNKCTDISIINDVIVIDSKSGIDVFSQSFGGRNLDTSLISGFLQAISNFGSAISEAAKESRTLTIEYKDSIVMQTEFVNLKLIVTLKENPSANFKFIMEDLAYDIYKQYGQEIDKFTGILKPFHNMSELIEQHLNVTFLYPLTIAENIKVKLNTSEKDMVQKARNFMKENNFDYFYSLYLLPANTCTPKDYQTIFDLIEKKVFLPNKKDI